MLKFDYRHDIDGLRAIAILGVLFYHLDLAYFPAGFLGVDVFFVISGFLITRLIYKELQEAGSFSFKAFYIRRFRRLFPALIVVLLLTTIIAILTMSSTLLERFGGGLVSSLLGIANIYFFTEVGYFDLNANFKPLLHLWSISIEEQFYMLWPLIFLFIFKLKKLWGVVLIILFIFLSLYLNAIFQDGDFQFSYNSLTFLNEYVSNGQSTVFYLLPFRAYEFLIGALLVLLSANLVTNNKIQDLLFFTGFVLVILSFSIFDRNTQFSLFTSLTPVVGTSLMIYSGQNSRLNFILTNKLIVGIGLISYSLYLIHWPVIVFYDYLTLNIEKNFERVLSIVVISFIFSILSYKFIEQPFRSKAGKYKHFKNHQNLYLFIGIFLYLILLWTGSNIYQNNGWSWRITRLIDTNNAYDFHRKYYGGNGYPYVGGVNTEYPADVVVLGDSHARQYMEGLFKSYTKEKNLNLYIASASCITLPSFTRVTAGHNWNQLCPNTLSQGLKFIENGNNPLVIISASWIFQMSVADLLDRNNNRKSKQIMVDDIIDGIEKLKEKIGDSKLIVIGMVPGASYNLAELYSRPDVFSWIGENSQLESSAIQKNRLNFNDKMQKYSEKGGFVFLDPHNALCKNNLCKNVSINGDLIYSDTNHLSKFGSIEVIKYFLPIIDKL